MGRGEARSQGPCKCGQHEEALQSPASAGGARGVALTSSRGAVCLCAGPFRVPAGQSSPSLTQLSALRQGRPAGPAALGEQRAPRCPGWRSEQPRVLQPSLEERKKQAESRAEAPGWAAKNADTTLQDDSAGGASAASLAPPGWTGPTLLVKTLFPDATLSPSRLLGLGWQEALMSFFPNVSFFHFGHASKRPVSNSTKHFVVAQSCPTLCDPTGCSMPGLPVPHHLPESAQIHVHRASDATWLLLNNLTGGTLGFFPAGVTPTRPTKPHGDTIRNQGRNETVGCRTQKDLRQTEEVSGERPDPHVRGSLQVHPMSSRFPGPQTEPHRGRSGPGNLSGNQ